MAISNQNDQQVAASTHAASDGETISAAARIMLKRVFRILRGCGISELELRDLATAAVDEVEGIPEAKPSRVTARRAMMCCDVVLGWRRNPKFLDESGAPAQLNFGDPSSQFRQLVESYAPKEDAISLLRTLEELGVVRIVDNKTVELISDSVVACSGKDGNAIASECVLEHICGFLGSVEFNVFDKPSRAKGRFERACYASVPRELVPILQQLVSTRGQDFIDVIDEWLSRRAVRTGETDDKVLVGAGAYVFVREQFQ